MSCASEKLYTGYLRRKMALIVSRVKVREIMPHLSCLTDKDREEVEAKRETSGNYIAMQHLLDCMKRRENWPDEFISGLEACDHHAMAEEIRAEYDSLKSQSGPEPASPPGATVVTAHVHPAPSDPGPEPVAPQAEAAAEPEPEPPVQPEESPIPAPQVTLDPAPQLPQSPQATPPPSPLTPPRQASPPPPDSEGLVAQDPEENAEMDFQLVTANEPPHREATPPPPEPESPAHTEPEGHSETDLQVDPPCREATPPPALEKESPSEEGITELDPQVATDDETVHQESTPPPAPESESPVLEEPVEMSEPAFQVGTSDETVDEEATPSPPPERESPVQEEPVESSEPTIHVGTSDETVHREATPPLASETETLVQEEPAEMSEPAFQVGTSDETVHREATPPPASESESPVQDEPVQEVPVETSEQAFQVGTGDETVHQEATPLPASDSESPVQQEPERISETDPIQFPGDKDLVSEETDAASNKVSGVNVEVTPEEPEAPVLESEMTVQCQPNEQSPVSAESDPAQDTAPPVEKVTATDPVPEDVLGPVATQVTGSADTTLLSVDEANGPDTALGDEGDDVCISKAVPLLSTGEPCSGDSEKLRIGDSMQTDSEPVAPAPAAAVCSASPADPEATESPPLCQENGVVEEPTSLPHIEPEENHCESSSCLASLGEQEVLVHEVHVSEEASIQNLDGQTPSMLGHDVNAHGKPSVQRYDDHPEITIQSPSCVSPESSFLSCEDKTESATQDETCPSEEPQAQIHNGQVTSALAKEPESAPPTSAVTVSIVGAPSTENCRSSKTGAVEASVEVKLVGSQDQKEKVPASNMSKYILTAAGVGACAMLVAWKLKN